MGLDMFIISTSKRAGDSVRRRQASHGERMMPPPSRKMYKWDTDYLAKEFEQACDEARKNPDLPAPKHEDYLPESYTEEELDLGDEFYRTEHEECYWRKVNCIHGWFIENVADGEDLCDYRRIEREDVERLAALIRRVLDRAVKNGELAPAPKGNYRWVESGPCPVGEWPEHSVSDDTMSYAAELLPVCEGFFFGHYGYDDYYIDHLILTLRDQLKPLLDRWDEDRAYFYTSSW